MVSYINLQPCFFASVNDVQPVDEYCKRVLFYSTSGLRILSSALLYRTAYEYLLSDKYGLVISHGRYYGPRSFVSGSLHINIFYGSEYVRGFYKF